MATTSPHASNGRITFTPNTIGRTWPVTATWSFNDPIEWLTFAFTAPDKTVKTIGLDLADIGLWCETFTSEEMGFLAWVTSNHDNGATIDLYAQSINLIRSINSKVEERLQASVTTMPTVPMGAKIEPQPVAPVKVSVPLAQRIAEAAKEDSAPIVPPGYPMAEKLVTAPVATVADQRTARNTVEALTRHTRADLSADVNSAHNRAEKVVNTLASDEVYTTFFYRIPKVLIPLGDMPQHIRRMFSVATVRRAGKRRRANGTNNESANHPCPNPSRLLWRNGFVRLDGSVWIGRKANMSNSAMVDLCNYWEGYKKQGLVNFAMSIHPESLQVMRDQAQRNFEDECAELGRSLVQCIADADTRLTAVMAREGVTSKEMETAETTRDNSVRAHIRKASKAIDDMIACASKFDDTMDVADAIEGLRIAYNAHREAFNQAMRSKGNYRGRV